MWSPTHIQVTVVQAKGLLIKGKNDTNNCFVTIALGKEKYQTSIKEKASTNVDWKEECELKIPDQGNRAELTLTALHRNNLSLDEFLGQVTLPLNEMDAYERPRSKWFKLESKPGKEKKNKERGELEVRIAFVVKSGSLTDLSKKEKHKSSIGQLASSVGGSLLSIGTIEKRKGIKKFAKSLGSKMHLHSKKKNKEGDDVSFNGSFSSIGTPNHSSGGGSGRKYGQRAGEADPGVISEDEDEFVFDNLSHKSSSSSLNVRNSMPAATLQVPNNNNYVPRNPSPLLGGVRKAGGKQLLSSNEMDDVEGKEGGEDGHVRVVQNNDDYDVIDPELQQIENDFSVRARTLPAPSKPPRIAGGVGAGTGGQLPEAGEIPEAKLNEWESKLYGKHLEIGSSDSLKRRSWELSRVPLPSASEEPEPEPESKKEELASSTDSDSSSSSDDNEEELKKQNTQKDDAPLVESKKPLALQLNLNGGNENGNEAKKPSPSINIITPEVESKGFEHLNASFAKFEQRNSSKIFDLDDEDDAAVVPVAKPNLNKWNSQALINQEAKKPMQPQPKPRVRDAVEPERAQAALRAAEEEAKRQQQLQYEEEQRRIRAEEDARLEAELMLNEQLLQEEEEALQEELRQQEEQKRREAKRREEDQKLLNFSKRSSLSSQGESGEDNETIANNNRNNNYNLNNHNQNASTTPPTHSPKEAPHLQQQQQQQQQSYEEEESNKAKRLGKFKYLNKRDKSEDRSSSPSPKVNERIIIGHEKSSSQAERRSEISAALAKKYEGKSREELMLIANGMENEALIQRQRVKELEDYLDNLLLRVMETHPKILQKPYSRTTSAKSFKNYINMNEFLSEKR